MNKPGYIEKLDKTVWRASFTSDDIHALLEFQFRERGQISDDIPVECEFEIVDGEFTGIVLTAETGRVEKQVFQGRVEKQVFQERQG